MAIDAYSLETISIMKEAFQRLRSTPLASYDLLKQMQTVITLAETDLYTEDDKDE